MTAAQPAALVLVLPYGGGEHSVFRAFAVLIALIFTVGQSPGFLCIVRCDPPVSARSTCHHEEASGSALVTADESCDTQALGALALVREDGRRSVRGWETHSAIPAPPSARVHSAIDVLFSCEPGHERPVDTRPTATALRI